MKLIPQDVVSETWQEVGQYSSERMSSESQLFFSRQREVAQFILELTEGQNEVVFSLACYVAYVIFCIFDKRTQEEMPVISHAAIEKAFESNQDWLLSLEDMDHRLLERRLKYSQDFRQTYVIEYMVEALYETDEEGRDLLDDDTRSLLVLVLKTIIDALDDTFED